MNMILAEAILVFSPLCVYWLTLFADAVDSDLPFAPESNILDGLAITEAEEVEVTKI